MSRRSRDTERLSEWIFDGMPSKIHSVEAAGRRSSRVWLPLATALAAAGASVTLGAAGPAGAADSPRAGTAGTVVTAGAAHTSAGAALTGATTTGWKLGAGRATVAPRAYNAADDATEFPLCNTTVFNGPRHFDDEEPYTDTNGNGKYDFTVDPKDETKTISEPFCDGNGNGRRDTLYDSGQVASEISSVHDDIYAKAIAVQDPVGHTALIAYVTSQGLFDSVTDAVRAKVVADMPTLASAGITVGATHNESSPDELGLYGAPDTGEDFGGTSGIDDYYSTYLISQTAAAIEAA